MLLPLKSETEILLPNIDLTGINDVLSTLKKFIYMRLTLAFILSIIFAVGLVAFGFTFFQSTAERNRLISELEIRTDEIAEEVLQNDVFYSGQINQNNIEHITDSISKRYNLLGIAIYYNSDSILCNNYTRNLISNSVNYISQAITADTSLGNFFTIAGERYLSIYQTG